MIDARLIFELCPNEVGLKIVITIDSKANYEKEAKEKKDRLYAKEDR
jgi:hypothetical protein